MPAVPFHYVDLRTFAYATEDVARVEEALRTLLPEDAPIERTDNEGYHGDRIVVLETRLENADEMRTVLEHVARRDDLERLLAELDERIDDNTSLYLTFDKQAAFQGSAARGDGITFRAKVEAYPATKEAAVENAREALEDLRDA